MLRHYNIRYSLVPTLKCMIVEKHHSDSQLITSMTKLSILYYINIKGRAFLTIFECVLGSQPSRVFPKILKSTISENVIITCNSHGKARWLFNRNILPLNAIVQGKNMQVLNITKVKLLNGGYYNCYGKIGNASNFLATAKLNVYG